MTYGQNDLAAENERLKQRIAELEDDGTKTAADQIAEAEAAGDWGTSIRLKTEQFGRAVAENEAAAQPVPTEETLVKIAELEAEGDYLGAGQMKLAASRPTAPTIDPDVAQQIADAEAAGDWGTSIALKLQASAIRVL